MNLAAAPAWAVSAQTAAKAGQAGIGGEPANALPKDLEGIGITEKLGSQLQLSSYRFKDEDGKDVQLSSYFNQGKPVLLSMVYFGCASLCTFVLKGQLEALKALEWTPGEQFEVVTVSVDHEEGPELAKIKRESYVEALGRPQAAKGWHFLTGGEPQIRSLADAVGFGFKEVARAPGSTTKDFAHGAAVFVLTPDGRISRILYGIEYGARTLKMALLEASGGKIGTILDRLVLFCYRYDPVTRKYSMVIMQVAQAAAGLTIFVFGGFLAAYWIRQRKLAAQGG